MLNLKQARELEELKRRLTVLFEINDKWNECYLYLDGQESDELFASYYDLYKALLTTIKEEGRHLGNL